MRCFAHIHLEDWKADGPRDPAFDSLDFAYRAGDRIGPDRQKQSSRSHNRLVGAHHHDRPARQACSLVRSRETHCHVRWVSWAVLVESRKGPRQAMFSIEWSVRGGSRLSRAACDLEAATQKVRDLASREPSLANSH